jgi:hypothetical protein
VTPHHSTDVVLVWDPAAGTGRTVHPVTRQPFTTDTGPAYADTLPGAQVLASRNGGPYRHHHPPRPSLLHRLLHRH